MLCPKRKYIKQGQDSVQVNWDSLSAQLVSHHVFCKSGYGISGVKANLPSLLSAHGLLKLLMVLRCGCFIAEFSVGLLLNFNNEFQPAYLFIYLPTYLF